MCFYVLYLFYEGRLESETSGNKTRRIWNGIRTHDLTNLNLCHPEYHVWSIYAFAFLILYAETFMLS